MDKITKNKRSLSALFLFTTLIFSGFFGVKDTSKAEIPAANNQQITVDQQLASNPPIQTTPVVNESPTPPATALEAKPAPVTQFKTVSGLALKINAINVNIPLGTTTLGANRELLVPANPNNAAWYKQGPKIGQSGTALITGHLDSPAGPGVFFNLRKLNPGDEIQVRRVDGKIATYKVDKLASYAQDHTFPWSIVYSTSGPSSLRIITCDGVLNSKTGRYSRNLVVYASLVSIS